MTKLIRTLSQQEQINFLLTNRVPRRLLTQWMGWFSRIENRWLTKVSIFIWRLFADDLDLSEAKHTGYRSLRDCFIRELKPGSRVVDASANTVSSPCDAIVGACGNIEGTTVYQAKGFPYELRDLIPEQYIREKYRDGVFVTLRLKSSMYHRFHAPLDCHIRKINYISGDTWNVNPVTLKRVEKLFCKNERAVLDLGIDQEGYAMCLVPVAAILVASMKFECLDEDLDLQYQGPNHIACNANYKKGDEMGYFQHGSTIIVFANKGFSLCEHLKTGDPIKMGEPLMMIKDLVN